MASACQTVGAVLRSRPTMLQGRWIGLGLCAAGLSWAATPAIEDSSFGYRLAGAAECAVWWCEALYKVGRQRPLPQATVEAVEIEAARNEYEPFQLVVYPEVPLSNVVVRVTDWVHRSDNSTVLPATHVEVRLVEYVPVEVPSDAGGSAGLYPDPLPPLPRDLVLTPFEQQPFWVTVYVPKTQPAGLYTGHIRMDADGMSEPLMVPVRLRVRDFSLPDFTHTRTLYDVALPLRWHGPLSDEQQQEVWDLYMENFRRHRVSPERPHRYAPIQWRWVGGRFTYDFRDFDRAMVRYLDEFGFNTFVYMDEPWTLLNSPRFEPQYNELFTMLLTGIALHLRQKGWLDKACTYWIDEPADSMIPFVRDGMHAHLYAAPDLRRLLTREPLPDLYGLVNTWVPMAVISIYNTTSDRWWDRMRAGEEVWWYVCTYPKWPAPNYFIDHPAITHRIRFWLAERYGLAGDLYWDVNWYLDREFQPINPWTQATVLNEYGQPMGNGDGVLLYPPVREPPTEPVVAGPIDSIRWELVREGLEDREYFWLLRELGRRRALQWGPDHPAVWAAESVRTEALRVALALTNYTLNPGELLAARRALAQAIEALTLREPFWVEEPVSKVVALGEPLVLRCEALGWPVPMYYWHKDGQVIAVTEEGRLRIEAVDPATPGDYQVVASNAFGRVTGRIVRVRGSWERSPELVVPPRPQAVRLGHPLVLSVVAVGEEPLEYAWFKDGEPVLSDGPSGPVFLRSNAPPEAKGLYTVVVSNSWGSVTSAPVPVAVHWENLGEMVLPAGADWLYDARGVGLEAGWQTNGAGNARWQLGRAPFGYGYAGVATPLAAADGTGPVTAYFLAPVVLSQPLPWVQGKAFADDGFVVYWNGREVLRWNLPQEPLSHGTSALHPVVESPVATPFVVPAEWVRPGTNWLAVQLHQYHDLLEPLGVWFFDEPEPPWEALGGGLPWQRTGTGVVSAARLWARCVSNAASPGSWLELQDQPRLRGDRPFTLGGWFAWQYGTSGTATSTALEKPGEYRLYYTGPQINRYRFQFGGVEVQEQTPGTGAGQWRLVIAWYDGTNACIQMDNGPVYRVPAVPAGSTTNPLVALRLEPGAGGFAADDVFFFGRVLSESERTAIYQLGIQRFVTNLMETVMEDLWFDLELESLLPCPPQFLGDPESLVRVEGESAGFELSAVGTAPLHYQWLFHGRPLEGATHSRLFLPAVSGVDSGLYALVASNAGGVATSAPARLLVVGRPSLEITPHQQPPGWSLHWPSFPLDSTLLSSTNLVDWTPIWTRSANSPATNWWLSVSPDLPAAFYRLQLHR